MKKTWLISWIGATDLKASVGTLLDGVGPIANALQSDTRYARVFLLTNYPYEQSRDYCTWLENLTSYQDVDLQQVDLTSPTNYSDIYKGVSDNLTALKLPKEDVTLHFHLSPGTPAMAAIWIMLAKTRFPATLIQSAKKKTGGGDFYEIEHIDFPFDLANDFLPEYLQRTEARIDQLAKNLPPPQPEFKKIIHQCDEMRRQIDRAQRAAPLNVPVLILGETGTGKELFADAIRQSSQRKSQPFVPINCGAISKDLINSELFGHKRGAFTGADKDRKGYFETANGGTLFLDEIGDLPLDAQVRLLRVLQKGEITPVGGSEIIKVDVRIIAATHRNLMAEVSAGTFREDLFHRLAVGVLNLPPIRERGGDIDLLIDHCIEKINARDDRNPEWQDKKFSEAARKILREYAWPGNFRELYHTVLRAALWSSQSEITAIDITENILTVPKATEDILSLELTQGFDLQRVLDRVEGQYIQKAMTKANGKKKQAAEYLGFKNYQTLSNRISKLHLQIDETDN